MGTGGRRGRHRRGHGASLTFGIDPAALAAFYAGAHADVPRLCAVLRAALAREAKLREALGFYAAPDTWTCEPPTTRVLDVLRLADTAEVPGVLLGTRPVMVGGTRARAALEETP